MSVTQKQIASHLGISQSLVAHALKGYSSVPDTTRRRVEVAAAELGYEIHSNTAARQLRARREGTRLPSMALAVMVGDFFEGVPVHDLPFYQPLIRGLRQEAARREMDLLLCVTPFRQRGLPRVITDGAVDGVICLYGDLSWAEDGTRVKCPVLRIGDGNPRDWALRPDDRQGIYLATRHLIELGHKEIAYLGDFRGDHTSDLAHKCRIEGYFEALRDAGIPVRNELVEAHIGAPTRAAGTAGMCNLCDRDGRFTAVVCYNDASAHGALEELQRRGISVPGDLSITGFDDVAEAYGSPSELTTVFFDREDMGRQAVAMICDAARSWDGAKPFEPRCEHRLLDVAVVARASTAPPSPQPRPR